MSEPNPSYQERLNRVLHHMENHLDDALPLHELAEVACFSPHHFHRIFTGMVGESVKSHLRRLRLQRAAHRLIFTELTVTDIALDAGYDSPEAFTRAFHVMYGTPPSRFRTDNRNGEIEPMAGPPYRPREAALASLSKGDFSMEVTIKTMPVTRVAFVRHVGPYIECAKAWTTLCAWAGPKGLLGPQSQFMGLGHDDPEITKADKIRYDACVNVGPDVEPEGAIGVKEIGGRQYAVVTHKGPYEKLYETYAYLAGVWAPEAKREIPSEPSIEIYLNDPETTPPEELLTEVRMAID